jgi:intracellular sulfur oxidation DsrE/DsrF family protein
MGSRRDFIVGAAVAASLAACNSGSESGSGQTGQASSNTFDDATFNQIVSKTAAHKHCFGIAGIDGGEGLYAINNTYATYAYSLNVPLNQLFLVGVLYRVEPVAIAFNDEMWNSVIIPALPHVSPALRSNFESVSVTTGNPFLYRPPNSNGEDASVESLVSRGTRFFVCANATQQLAKAIGAATRQDPQTIYQAFASNLVQGASLVPTGVWAILALQEAHFTYLQATI